MDVRNENWAAVPLCQQRPSSSYSTTVAGRSRIPVVALIKHLSSRQTAYNSQSRVATMIFTTLYKGFPAKLLILVLPAVPLCPFTL